METLKAPPPSCCRRCRCRRSRNRIVAATDVPGTTSRILTSDQRGQLLEEIEGSSILKKTLRGSVGGRDLKPTTVLCHDQNQQRPRHHRRHSTSYASIFSDGQAGFSSSSSISGNISPKWKAVVMGPRCLCSGKSVRPSSSCRQRRPLAIASFAILFILSLMVHAGDAHDCQVEHCTRQYQRAIESGAVAKGPHRHYCKILWTYLTCIRATARSCRGNLKYHTTSSLVEQWNHEYNCTYIGTSSSHNHNGQNEDDDEHESHHHRPDRPDGFPSVTKAGRPPRPVNRECMYNGRSGHDMRVCGLFGDPHLRTFNDERQTCKILGAWPLIDNAYLAVQVTNDPVIPGSKVSATSKVTVIIKSHAPCSDEKTYEAQTDNVPSTFVDGTQSSGLDRSVKIRDREPGRHVEIVIKYIATTIIVRQVGRYLTFAVRMPREVAFQTGPRSEGLELCVKGCPHNERIDPRHVIAHPHSLREIVGTSRIAMPREIAIAKCRTHHNLTDFFLESCVFDLMTTGDVSFGDAAAIAMQDQQRWGDRSSGGGGGQLPPMFPTSVNYPGGGNSDYARKDSLPPTVDDRSPLGAATTSGANSNLCHYGWCHLILICAIHVLLVNR